MIIAERAAAQTVCRLRHGPAREPPDHDRVVVISDALWSRRFHRDRGLVGRSITLDGIPHLVLGVLPPSFHLPQGEGIGSFPSKADVFKPAGSI
jgi:hypothetical protein